MKFRLRHKSVPVELQILSNRSGFHLPKKWAWPQNQRARNSMLHRLTLKSKKLREINSEPIDVTTIQSQVDKVAINLTPADNKKIVFNEGIAKELGPDYIKPLSPNTLEADRQTALHQILERHEMKKVAKSSSRYAYKYFG